MAVFGKEDPEIAAFIVVARRIFADMSEEWMSEEWRETWFAQRFADARDEHDYTRLLCVQDGSAAVWFKRWLDDKTRAPRWALIGFSLYASAPTWARQLGFCSEKEAGVVRKKNRMGKLYAVWPENWLTEVRALGIRKKPPGEKRQDRSKTAVPALAPVTRVPEAKTPETRRERRQMPFRPGAYVYRIQSDGSAKLALCTAILPDAIMIEERAEELPVRDVFDDWLPIPSYCVAGARRTGGYTAPAGYTALVQQLKQEGGQTPEQGEPPAEAINRLINPEG